MSTSLPTFNGPFKRAELLLLPQYAASDVFLTNGKWTGSPSHLLSVESITDGMKTIEPLYCIIIGTISANKAYLGKHGNFSTKYTEDARKAKLQFTVTRPNDPDFGPDFDKAVIAFEEHQQIISESPRHRFFLLKEEENAMRMNFSLFEPRSDSNDRDREKETRSYNIDQQYESYWDTAKSTHYSCIMPVYDTNDLPVDPIRFAQKLIGAMCEITFTLRHYAIGSRRHQDGSEIQSNDVFSAQVETISILRQPQVLARSPYKGRLTRKPHHTPQLPTRGEQINAARAFISRGDISSPPMTPCLDTTPVLTVASHGIPFTRAGTIDTSVAIAAILSPVITASSEPTPQSLEQASDTTTATCIDIPSPTVTKSPTPYVSTETEAVTPEVIESQGSSASIGTLTSDSGKELDGHVPALKKRKIAK